MPIGSWTSKPGIPTSARTNFGAAIQGSIAYLLGGRDDGNFRTDLNQAYHLEHDTWETKTPLPTKRTAHWISPHSNGKIYFGSGEIGEPTIGVSEANCHYDPDTDSYTEALAALPVVLIGATAAPGMDGLIHVYGGDISIGRHYSYDPVTDDPWTAELALPTPRRFLTSAWSNDLRYHYLLGGNESPFKVERYDVQADSWSTRTAMPFNLSDGEGAMVPDEGFVHVLFGDSRHYAFDDSANTWTSYAAGVNNLTDGFGLGYRGRFYILGGSQGGIPQSVNQMFQAVRDADLNVSGWGILIT